MSLNDVILFVSVDSKMDTDYTPEIFRKQDTGEDMAVSPKEQTETSLPGR